MNKSKKILRSFFSLLLLGIIVSTSRLDAQALPDIIHEEKQVENLASGVVHERYLRFTTRGWWNINIVRIDLTNPHTEIKGLFNDNGISNRTRVSKLLNDKGALAAINGDYFNYSPLPSAMGTMINQGEVISSPIERAYALPTIMIDSMKKASIQYMDRSIVLTNLSQGITSHINTLNKITKDAKTATILNKNFAKVSPGNKFLKENSLEILVVDDVVKDIRENMEPVEIPENGYLVHVHKEAGANLLNYQIGDKLELKVSTSPNNLDLIFAMGGGSVILRDGNVVNTNIVSRGNQPRTGIAINKDSSEIFFITIDGRGNSYKGVSQETFGALIKSFGGHDALNLDGGGSTTMAIKAKDQDEVKIANSPSDGGERPVVNAIGVFSNGPVGEINNIKLQALNKELFSNTSTYFKVRAYDEHQNPIDIDEELLVFSSEEGEILDNNRVKFTKPGKHSVKVNYQDFEASTDIMVYGEIESLKYKDNNIRLRPGKEYNFKNFTGQDKGGRELEVLAEDVEFSIVNSIGSIDKTVFLAGEENKAGAVIARAGKGNANIIISIGSEGILIDPLNTLDNVELTSHPKDTPSSINLSLDSVDNMSSISLAYDFTNTDQTRAVYLNFQPAKIIDGKPTAIGVHLKGDGNNGWLRGSLKDREGNPLTIDFTKLIDFTDWRYLVADIPSGLKYPLTLERIYLVETHENNKYTGEILIDSLMVEYPISTDGLELPKENKLIDYMIAKQPLVEGGFSIGISHTPKADEELAKANRPRVQKALSSNNMAIFMKSGSDEYVKGVKSETKIYGGLSYQKNKKDNFTFISLRSDSTGIRGAKNDQYFALAKDFEKLDTDNLMILLTNSPDSFKDKLEAKYFHSLLVELEKAGKNVFVVSSSDKNSAQLKDGIRYINLRDNKISPEDQTMYILEFMVNPNSITYEIRSID